MPAASCALRGGLRLLRQPPDNATAPAGAAVIVCADGKFPATGAENWGRNSLPYVAACLRKPATGSFAAEMGGRSARPFSLLRKRNRKKKRGERAMAIYHLEAKVVSRGAGRSAVAASAYLSCSRLYNDYDGIQHDYTKKQGLVWQDVFLPEYALQEWQDREKLWNAVEEVETAKDSRLAREFVVALPIELSREQQIELLQEFIRGQFVSDGMCADAAIHDTDGHNPHAHILLTVRPLDEQGKWQYKTEKEYLCMKNGEERGFTAAEFRTVQADGWDIRSGKAHIQKSLSVWKPELERYTGLVQQIKEKSKERKALVAEKKELPVYHVKRHKALAVCIAELTEELEELRSEKALLLQKFEYAEDAGAETFRKDIATMEAGLKKLEAQEQKYSAELDKALDEYAELKAQAADFDPVELYKARQGIRPAQEKESEKQLEDAMHEKPSLIMLLGAKQETSRLLGDDADERQVRQILIRRQRSDPQKSKHFQR